MNVIITMAGAGSRFKQRGIEQEKYRLQLRGQTMFEFAMNSLRAFFGHRFVFVAREEHDARSFIETKCASLGIDEYEIVELSELTSGQATTALEAASAVDPDASVLIYNIDTYVSGEHLTEKTIQGDGCIPVFEADGGSWSFVETGPDGLATAVREKEPISSLASLGLYYFNSMSLFETAFESMGADVETEYGERYIAPLYNWLIDNGYDVTVPRVPRAAVHILGTPADAQEFDPKFAERYNLD